MKPVKVLLDCDSTLLRESLTSLLHAQQDFDCTDAAANGGLDADIIVLVLPCGHPSGLRSIAEWQAMHGKVPILVVSLSKDAAFGIDCLRAGASGFLASDACRIDFTEAVRNVSRGGRYISATLAAIMAGDAQLFPRPLHPELSFRELQVMQGYAAGKGSKEIASELSVSIKTVSTYRNRLLGKLRLRNNADLVLYAFHNDLLQSGAGGTRSTAAGR